MIIFDFRNLIENVSEIKKEKKNGWKLQLQKLGGNKSKFQKQKTRNNLLPS